MQYLARWRLILVFSLCSLGIWFGAQNFFSPQFLAALPSFFPKNQIALGLDLQGGSSILLEVDLSKVVEDYLLSLCDEIKREFRKNKISYLNLRVAPGQQALTLSLRLPSQRDEALRAVKLVDRRLSLSGTDSALTIVLPSELREEREQSAIQQSLQIVTRRIDEMGTKEPSIQKQGRNRILVQLPGVSDPRLIKEMLGKTAKLSFRLLHPSLLPSDVHSPPYGYEILEGSEETPGAPVYKYLVQKKSDVSGEMLTSANVNADSEGGVSFSLDAIGARKFNEVTRDNTGRFLAIVLDNKVISAPKIKGAIPGGHGVITGAGSLQEARNLAILLRAGALPAPLTVLEERTVGPELGSDSIKSGERAILMSVGGIIIFMFVFYGFLFGGIANFCLVMNLVFLLAGLSLLDATLTLPGIAGIALTLGMAVDANILIYERIREEIRDRQPPLSAISAGYSRAMATIVDSNVTTLIGAALLYHFGNGPVKGFAVTLALGILVSMFTAITLSRILTLSWLKLKGQHKPLPL